jgi:hypothetical protein
LAQGGNVITQQDLSEKLLDRRLLLQVALVAQEP